MCRTAYLTATFPSSDEDELFGALSLPRELVSVFRDSTTRLNIKYCVVKYDDMRRDQADSQVQALVEKASSYSSKAGKIVIYSNTVARAQQVAIRLGCVAYHSQVGERCSVLEDFLRGPTRVIVATNALGLGIDLPDIRCVIHMDCATAGLCSKERACRA